MQRRVTSGVSRISARGVLMVRPDTKSERGGGGVGGGAVRFSSFIVVFRCFAAKILYKSIIFNNVSTYGRGGCSSTRSTLSGYTPLGDHECREG